MAAAVSNASSLDGALEVGMALCMASHTAMDQQNRRNKSIVDAIHGLGYHTAADTTIKDDWQSTAASIRAEQTFAAPLSITAAAPQWASEAAVSRTTGRCVSNLPVMPQ